MFDYVFQTDDPHTHDVPDSSNDQRRAWHKGRYLSIREHLSDIDWDCELADRKYK